MALFEALFKKIHDDFLGLRKRKEIQKMFGQYLVNVKSVKKVNVESVIKVNVGGTIFETTAETLQKDVGNVRKHLLQRLSEEYQKNKDPFIFIDRDPTYFRYILNFLRDFDTYVSQFGESTSRFRIEKFLKSIASEELKQALHKEFEYFEIKEQKSYMY